MANRFCGEIEIEFMEAPRVYRFDTNVAVELEKMLGMPFTDIVNELRARKLRFQFVRDALYAGLRERWGKSASPLTPRSVGRSMDPAQLAYYAEKIAEALALFMPEPEEGDAELEADLDEGPAEGPAEDPPGE